MKTMSKTEESAPREKKRIRLIKDGPYLVTGGIPLVQQTIMTDADEYPHGYRESNRYPLQQNYLLCRCGQSGNKPFCDGRHKKVNFDGTETASEESYLDMAREIEGPSLNLTDAESLCAITRFCQRVGGIWYLTRHSDNAENMRNAIEEAADCPSGRLVVWDKKTGNAIEPEFERCISVIEDEPQGASGPIWVQGGIPVESVDGSVYEIRNRVTLCRCGKSSNKPFCDGSHLEPEEE